MIRLSIGGVPPSSNNAYVNIRGGGRMLSTEGKKYKAETTAHLARNYPREMMFFQPNTPYIVMVRFHFKTIVNSGYPKKAESRYKRLDVSNRLKLLEDCLKDAGGIDDSQYMQLFLDKRECPHEETIIWAWAPDKEETPFHGALNLI